MDECSVRSHLASEEANQPWMRERQDQTMRKIHVLLLSLVAMLAFSAMATSAASAFEILCLKDSGSTIKPLFLTEAECLAMTPVNETGTWYLGYEWLVSGAVVPAGGVTVDVGTTDPSGGTHFILLEDMAAGPLKQATDIECEGTGLGLLLPEGLDEQNSIKPENCKRGTPTGACSALDAVRPVNLPWTTALIPVSGSETEAEDNPISGTGGNPGWAVECETALGKKTDTCTTNLGKTLATQEGEEIKSNFPETAAESEWAECTEGSPKLNGLVVGNIYIKALVSGVLVPLTIS